MQTDRQTNEFFSYDPLYSRGNIGFRTHEFESTMGDPRGLTSENLNYSKDRVQRSKKHWFQKSVIVINNDYNTWSYQRQSRSTNLN